MLVLDILPIVLCGKEIADCAASGGDRVAADFRAVAFGDAVEDFLEAVLGVLADLELVSTMELGWRAERAPSSHIQGLCNQILLLHQDFARMGSCEASKSLLLCIQSFAVVS